MENLTSATTENPELPRRPGRAAGSKGRPAAADDNATYSYERPSRGSWPSKVPPTGAPMTGVLGELAFYYGACWLHYRSEPPRRVE